jgi:hypothetical protein
MRREEFAIGRPFRCGGKLWRCTDVGTRVVVAIRLDKLRVASTGGNRTLAHHEAEAEGWFRGPPYAVAETVFDEHGQEACEPVDVERSTAQPPGGTAATSSST